MFSYINHNNNEGVHLSLFFSDSFDVIHSRVKGFYKRKTSFILKAGKAKLEWNHLTEQ